ncbi:MAG: phosphatidylserine decarboxylase [Treponema sp.]|jgi:phosphatidylserine decarboxylase|nr:phosphatidylserine decarboxylase [Treponema sp.]
MRIPITKYGLPQAALFPVVVCTIMTVLFAVFRTAPGAMAAEGVLFAVLLWMLSFFRDPSRRIVQDETALLSPADGKVTDIAVVEDSGLGERALRIGIFLSIFNVHLNRTPCSVRIEGLSYKKGRFRNAMSPESGRVNESNDVFMMRLEEPRDRLLVRQISGAIARHIVCEAKENDEYRQGDRFGMIKFGSRTELYLPAPEDGRYDITVTTGDPVRAGLTPLVRYRR